MKRCLNDVLDRAVQRCFIVQNGENEHKKWEWTTKSSGMFFFFWSYRNFSFFDCKKKEKFLTPYTFWTQNDF